jgi:hypothetical protein
VRKFQFGLRDGAAAGGNGQGESRDQAFELHLSSPL